MSLLRANRALRSLTSWSGSSEQDLYFYVKEFFRYVLGYPEDHIIICEPGRTGIPDISLCSKDVKPKDGIYWVVGEVKKTAGVFRDRAYREERWKVQLSRYITPDTVYALLIDPITIAVLLPDGREVKVVELDQVDVSNLRSVTDPNSLAFLAYDESISERSLSVFKEGEAPSRYIDVTTEEGRKKFYQALRVSARELIDYSVRRLKNLLRDYDEYTNRLKELEESPFSTDAEALEAAKKKLRKEHSKSIRLVEEILPAFEQQIGRAVPGRGRKALNFLIEVYATEGSSLLLARILFIRFFEDHGLVTRKISNGGVRAFREFYKYIKDDYRFLLTSAYRDLESLYSKLFEPSIFDFAHEGDGELSKILLRIFYRLNAFDFTKISGDVLGNLYERFLDVDKRKKIGEYYTPLPVAKYVLDRIGFFEDPGPLLDPGCGSGTFLIAAMTGLIERLRAKGVKLDAAIRMAVELIHGLDINVFAAFIAQMQLIWHLFPYLMEAGLREIPELKVYGGVNSLIYLPHHTLTAYALNTIEDAIKVRDSRYKYVVGNPPYIRNERLKDRGPWREYYHEVDFRNSDVAFFFVARAIEGGKKPSKKRRLADRMPPWLEEGGRMCFVLPRGICDSKAAEPLRKKLLKYRILEVTDLEDVAIHLFPSPQASGRATTAPVLLFIERTSANEDHLVDIVNVPEKALKQTGFDPEHFERSKVPQKMFHRNKINPLGQILTKLRDGDIPVLNKLMAHSKLGEFTQKPTPTHGIKVGRKGRLSHTSGEGLLPFGKGLNIYTFYLDRRVSRWVDITKVENASIWAYDVGAHAFAISKIALAPQCVYFDPRGFALNDSTIVFVPKPEFCDFPWDVLVNSSINRFVHLLTLRTGLVGVGTPVGKNRRASWCAHYPRVVAAFPVPEKLLESPGELIPISLELRSLAEKIARRWEMVDETIDNAPKKPLALFDVRFTGWEDLEEGVELRLEEENGKWLLRPYVNRQALLMQIEGPYEVLNVVKYMIETRGGAIRAEDLQSLGLPEDVASISELIDNARDPESPDIKEFKALHARADEIIAQAFDLSERELGYILDRLSRPPLDVLQPRWPWTPVERREIKEYEADRFA